MAMNIFRILLLPVIAIQSVIGVLKATKPNKKYNRPRKEDDENQN
jgi:hypothetical protein